MLNGKEEEHKEKKRPETILLRELAGDYEVPKDVEYINLVNEILEKIDYDKLYLSCNSADTSYASDILLSMHQSFEKVYGEGYVNELCGMVTMPAVVRGRNTDAYALALVTIDLPSSGLRWGTTFLTPLGVLEQQNWDRPDEERVFLEKNFASYDYWYTPLVERDHHVDFASMPEQAVNIRRKVDEWLVTGETEQAEGPQMDGPK